MTGPLPVYSLRPALTGEAEAFLRLMLARATTAPGGEPPATSWLQAYRCTRCQACGAGVRIGSRCRQCGGPR